jgi:hypothetical protein
MFDAEVWLLLVLGVVAWFWWDSFQARDAGIQAVREACADADFQLLDDTVVLGPLRLVRSEAGQLVLQRVYHFEYSDDGDNRRPGSVTLQGHDVVLIRLQPVRHLYRVQ